MRRIKLPTFTIENAFPPYCHVDMSHWYDEITKILDGDFTLPGYKYTGPGNDLDKGDPVNSLDAKSKEHDLKYNEFIEDGKNPYLYFNEADERYLNEIEDEDSFAAYLAWIIFTGKKHLAPEMAPTYKQTKLYYSSRRNRQQFDDETEERRRKNQEDYETYMDWQADHPDSRPKRYRPYGPSRQGFLRHTQLKAYRARAKLRHYRIVTAWLRALRRRGRRNHKYTRRYKRHRRYRRRR